MTNVLVKSVVGSESHCVNLLDEILCQGPDSLSLVAGGQTISFNAAILCSLSPLLSTLVRQSTEDNGCSLHQNIFVFLPDLRNWKTVKLLKTFISSGTVGNVSRVEIEDLRNLLETLGFNISWEEHPALQAGVQDEEEQYFVEIKYEPEDDSELLEKEELFTCIQLERNNFEEIKSLIVSGNSPSRNSMEVRNIEMVQDEDLEINQGADGTLPTNVNPSDTNDNYNTEIDSVQETTTKFAKVENKLSKGSKRQTKRKIDKRITPTIDALELETVDSAPQDFECKQRRISYSSCKNKTLPQRPKRKLPKRKAKHSVFEVTENVCGRNKTEKPEHLKRHVKAIHKKVQYSCNQCDYKSKYMGELMRHIQSVHNEMRRLSDLKLHVNRVHESIRFPCSKCDYSGTQLRLLKQHIRMNHGEIQHSCSQCDYKSKLRGELKWHIQSVHNEICYPCSKCDFKSAYKRVLVRHNRELHEGVKYLCSKCDFKCKRFYLLKDHVKSAHH